MFRVDDMANVTDDEFCGNNQNHEEHKWDWYSADHGLGVLTFNCPGVANWLQ
ncbi:hypothetical protein PP914_gp137 [Arthrobacter phage Qui]|uniref:Uncharacterized protein n=1 Tax=Arthrobacter phage Qui TaxID=2603260 RepID=A0A5B8WK72_9CAUD|nr:hypothetical protein PP914_gp137 [Arthrobacter phage Qui]QED11626.1 hypothetical protein SEA_QUI_137 [Arthrobacter phage Qui]